MMRKAPPLPFLPAEGHGKEVLIFAACYAGDIAEGEKAMRPLRALGKPIADVISPHPFAGWQQAFDPLLTPGRAQLLEEPRLRRPPDGAIERDARRRAQRSPRPSARCSSPTSAARWRGSRPTPRLPAAGGALHDERAYPLARPGRRRRLHRLGAGALRGDRAFATGSVYVNFMPEDEADRVGAPTARTTAGWPRSRPVRPGQPVPDQPECPTNQPQEDVNELVRQTIHLRAGSGVRLTTLLKHSGPSRTKRSSRLNPLGAPACGLVDNAGRLPTGSTGAISRSGHLMRYKRLTS